MTRHGGVRGDDGRYAGEESYAGHITAAIAATAGAIVLAQVSYRRGYAAWVQRQTRRAKLGEPTSAHPIDDAGYRMNSDD